MLALGFVAGRNLARSGGSCHAISVQNPFAHQVCFDRDALRERAIEDRHLLVDAGVLPSWVRGALADYLGSRIEERLAEVEALARSGSVARDFGGELADRLYRARLVGYDGLSLCIESFDAIARDRVLHSDDSRTLLHLLSAARNGRLRLALPESLRALRGYRQSEPVADWLDELGEVPDSWLLSIQGDARASEQPEPSAPGPEPPEKVSKPAPEIAPTRELEDDEADLGEELITRRFKAPSRGVGRGQMPLFVDASEANEAAQVSAEVSRAQQIRELCAALSSAQGATSFAALEDLFLTAYCPLEQALGDDPGQLAQREVLANWAHKFEDCYRQAFEHMRSSRQRPRMVFDAPKLAFELGRAHDAPAFDLVLVDAFRFDVGQRVFEKLRLQLSGQAECVARGVLWAPLPSNTAATLELLARGADGLRNLRAELQEASVVSIKEARRLRKLRAGPHSLFKLDAVQALLEPGKAWDSHGLDQLAAEVSVSSARFMKQKAPGALVFLFGDHGFRLADGGHGGASPAEVLVPYQAWRVLERARATAAE